MDIDGAKPMTRVHVLPLDGERKIVYCPDTMRFFVVKAGLIPLIRQVANGADLDDLNAKGFSITDRQLNELREKLGGVHVRSVGCPPAGQLPRLVLNISNDCNMRCKYCYANCGDYGGQRGLMSVDTLTRARLFLQQISGDCRYPIVWRGADAEHAGNQTGLRVLY